MRLVQYIDTAAQRRVGVLEDGDIVVPLGGAGSVLELAQRALAQQIGLADLVQACREDRAALPCAQAGRLLAPIDHPDPAHLMVSGTGLTHLGSAAARADMHGAGDVEETDSMKMFRLGVEGGKPRDGGAGVQPEWFYKGDGAIICAPQTDIPQPAFALDGSEEPEIAGVYVIDARGAPVRIGFVLGNEFSDHVMERQNYLYLAHSKLRACALGPELLLGDLPAHIEGRSRLYRDGRVIWEKPFLSGEDNMSHSIANLEHHHFKYDRFCRPGDVHVHFFGTATLSFADGVRTRDGDVFEISASPFSRAVRNRLVMRPARPVRVVSL